MGTLSSLRSPRHLVAGTAVAATALLLASAAPATATLPVPPAPPASGSTADQVAGSVDGLGQNLMGLQSGTEPGATTHAGHGTGPDRYVALGDSYAAVGRIAPGAWTPGPISCARTGDAYPVAVARELGVGTFVNATCGGAVTDDLWAPDDGVPAQFDALSEDTDLVSLTIGGNDVGFGAVITACAVRTGTAEPLLPLFDAVTGPTSEDFDTSAGCTDVLDRQATDALSVLDAHLDEVYAEIARRSPGAEVVTVGYLAAMPEDDREVRESPACAPLMAATEEERDLMRGFQIALNEVVRDAAERNGATAVIPDESGHSMCSPAESRWVDLLGVETGAAPVHPTTAGQAHVADRVVTALGEGG